MIRTCAQVQSEVVQNCVLHTEQLCMYELELVPLHMSLCVLGHCLDVRPSAPTPVPCTACHLGEHTLIMYVLLAFLFR